MFRVTLALCGLLLCLTVGGIDAMPAHSVDISGEVVDAETGRPIPYASVQIEGTSKGNLADSLGNFVLSHVHNGAHTLMVSSVGYRTQKLQLALPEDNARGLRVELQPTQIDAGSIVVTGTRTPRYVKDVPIFTEVVSKTSIEDKAAHNIFEALDGEAGVRVEQQCQGCNFAILRMQGLGADHTQVLLDGQPVYSGLAAVYGLQQLSTADVDQIEIVKGAGSALYGSNAVAGAINIISSIPTRTEARVNMELGQYGTNKYDISAGARKNNLGLFVFAQQHEQDELDATGDINAPNGVDEPDGWIDRVRSNTQNFGFNLFLDDVAGAGRLVLRGRTMNETRSGGWLTGNQFENPFAPGTERIVTDRYTGQMEYKTWLSSGTEIGASVSFTRHKRDATNDTFLSDYEEVLGTPPLVDLMRPYIADEELLVTNLNLVQPVGSSHRLMFGAQFNHNKLEESGMYVDPDAAVPYMSTSKKSANEIGLYLQDEVKIGPKLEIVGGVRFDHHASEDEFRGSGDVLPQGMEPLEYDESSCNPRFSIKYAANDELVFRGSVGSGYRVPYGFSEDLHLCSGSPRVYKGGNLKPEKSVSYSVSADYTRPTFTASVNLYRTELKDAIAFAEADQQVLDLGYTYQWENIDDATVMGMEVNGALVISPVVGIGFRGELFSGEYDHPRDDWVGTAYESISRNVSRYPELSGGLKLEVTPENWRLVADADFRGKMYIDLTEPEDETDVKIHETESYVTLNVRISREFMKRYTLYVGAHNVTDYTQEEKHISDAAFMYAPVYGRVIYGGLTISL